MTKTSVIELKSVDVLDAVRAIVDAFHSGAIDKVHEALAQIQAPANDELYSRLGQMTRALHTSLAEFKLSLSRDNLTMSTTNIPDASDKLESVIQLTLNAANTTLDCTEQNATCYLHLQRHNSRLLEILAQPDWGTEYSRKELHDLAIATQSEIRKVEELNSKIMVTQNFQDLTGQSIRKVILLVSRLEKQLVELVQTFGGQIEPRPTSPQPIPADPTATTLGKLDQDDADSVLKQFGF